MDDTFCSIRAAATAQRKIEGSRFIADVLPVTEENEAKEHLERIRKKYFDATHHCYAYVIGAGRTIVRHSDDGEPSGTAGVKIHAAILSHHLSDILVVVTRYFGGTKLGVGGLGRAYFDSADTALKQSQKITKAVVVETTISFQFIDTNPVMNIINTRKIKIERNEYINDRPRLTLLIPQSHIADVQEKLRDATRGNIHVQVGERKTVILS